MNMTNLKPYEENGYIFFVVVYDSLTNEHRIEKSFKTRYSAKQWMLQQSWNFLHVADHELLSIKGMVRKYPNEYSNTKQL